MRRPTVQSLPLQQGFPGQSKAPKAILDLLIAFEMALSRLQKANVIKLITVVIYLDSMVKS
jgi:hypothetical protein